MLKTIAPNRLTVFLALSLITVVLLSAAFLGESAGADDDRRFGVRGGGIAGGEFRDART